MRSPRLLILTAIAASLSLLVEDAAADSLSDESRFVELINGERSAAGLGPLSADPPLVNSGRGQSARMAAQGAIFHNPNLANEFAAGGWAALGENVGVGPTVDDLHRAFMNSPSHRANVLGDYDRVGLGVVIDGSTIYVTEVFWKTAGTRRITSPRRTCRKVGRRTVCRSSRRRRRRRAMEAPVTSSHTPAFHASFSSLLEETRAPRCESVPICSRIGK